MVDRVGDGNDYVVLAASWFLTLNVAETADGIQRADESAVQQHGADMVYVFAEFMQARGLLQQGVNVSPTPDFKLFYSDLTDVGKAFARDSLDKWMRSFERAGVSKKLDASGLERRFAKFVKASAQV